MKVNNTSFIDVSNCPLCLDTNPKTIHSILYYSRLVLDSLNIYDSPDISLVECRKCGHRYANKVIKQNLLDHYYSEINSEYYINKNDETIDDQIRKNQFIKRIIEVKNKPGGKILEIGTGFGFLLSYFDRRKWDCYAAEPSPIAADFARRKFGILVENKLYTKDLYPESYFDTIVAIDVVEHLHDPIRFFNDVHYNIKPGVPLIIGTADATSINALLGKENWSYFTSFEHIQFFTKKSIRYVLNQAGFKEVSVIRTSYSGTFMSNVLIQLRNLIKFILFKVFKLKKRFSAHLCFDHMIVIATK